MTVCPYHIILKKSGVQEAIEQKEKRRIREETLSGQVETVQDRRRDQMCEKKLKARRTEEGVPAADRWGDDDLRFFRQQIADTRLGETVQDTGHLFCISSGVQSAP